MLYLSYCLSYYLMPAKGMVFHLFLKVNAQSSLKFYFHCFIFVWIADCQLFHASYLRTVSVKTVSVKTVSYHLLWVFQLPNINQACILSPCLFNLYAEYIMSNTGLEEAQAGIKISGEILITSDMQMTPPLWQKVKKN